MFTAAKLITGGDIASHGYSAIGQWRINELLGFMRAAAAFINGAYFAEIWSDGRIRPGGEYCGSG